MPAESFRPGDMVATNNPWWIMGHLNDIAVVAPLFHRGKLVAFAECMAHMADIGGSLSGAPREVYEEGLIIPPLKLFDRGRENATFFAMLEANVRVPSQVAGDVRALAAGCTVMERKLSEFLDRHDLPDLTDLGATIRARSERTMRKALASTVPDGVYEGETTVDGFDEPLLIRARVTARNGDVDIDFAGSSPQSALGINSTMVLHQRVGDVHDEVPRRASTAQQRGHVRADRGHRAGGLVPQSEVARAGEDEAVERPLHPIAILNALADAVPDRMLAESGNNFLLDMAGRDDRARLLRPDVRDGRHGRARGARRIALHELSGELVEHSGRGARAGAAGPRAPACAAPRFRRCGTLPRRLRAGLRAGIGRRGADHAARRARQARDRATRAARRTAGQCGRLVPQRQAGS